MKLIFINRFFHPDESATSLMLTDLVCGLDAPGVERLVITGKAGYTEEAAGMPEGLDGAKVLRLPSLPISNQSLFGRALNFIAFYCGLVVAGLAHIRRGDIVICLTDPPFSNVVVHFLSSLKRARVINWVQDIYPETAARLGFGSESGWLVRLATRMRDRAWQGAAANVCIGETMRWHLASHGAPKTRLHVIPNWADERALTPLDADANPLRREWGFSSDDLIIGYSGNLGRAHDAATMLGAAKRLAAEGETQIKFLFIGGGAKHALLSETASEPDLAAIVQRRGYRPRSELRASLSLPDVHWLSLEPELEGLIVPSKFYGAIAVGRPIIFIGDPEGEIARLIRDANCGTSCSKGDVEGLINFLLKLEADPDLVQRLGHNARAYCERYLRQETRLLQWQRVIAQVGNSRSS
ncbi:glycosyltransferase family 4 protein [Altererythrobacter sp. GH1-8]|uniref:glycosyltransferase family 4 protein n=1 Tax=Altererythrobacter sp. GH1-8 TaxID=3349333 RepID=UPI00374D271B